MNNETSAELAEIQRSGVLLTRIHASVFASQALALAAIVLLGLQNYRFSPTLVTMIGLQVLTVAGGVLLRRIAIRFRRREAEINAASRKSREQTEDLFAMTDMLQAAETYEDAGAVLMASSRQLMPGHGAALYVFNNSRDRLDLSCSWDLPQAYAPPETLSPGNCWALKRGKIHVNAPLQGGLCCAHHAGTEATVEIPMMACGQVHGLLVLSCNAANAAAPVAGDAALDGAYVAAISRLGRAIADSMSLALSNIGLREKLRTQSLRDPLTGLYNRRYMEDALQRFLALGTRTGTSTAVIMLDLDNFKSLNDKFGHAKGDAVLRDAAAQIIGALRPSDVACRYGGEELLAILPDCPLDDALDKAEVLRQRIAALSEAHGCTISASFGVATLPETTLNDADVVTLADGALYAAKKAGKNRVMAAERRLPAEPRLAVTERKIA